MSVHSASRISRNWFPLLVVLAFASSGSATGYHVAKSGLDNNTGSANSPFLTIGKAAQVAQAGDSIVVHAGIYREWVQPPRGGSSETARITYSAAPQEIVEIKGSEQITSWVSQGSGVWKVDMPDAFFGINNNPFTYTLQGRYPGEGSQYLFGGATFHLGEVYLDNQIYLERATLSEVQNNQKTWYTSHAGTTTSIYANFGTNNPNTQLAEINARQCVFGNLSTTSGINYITVDGFRISQSAEEWCPPYRGSPSISPSLVFPSGTNWIIQNCRIKFAKMRGINCDGSFANSNQIVRNCVITECGIAGIAGSGQDGNIYTGNWIANMGSRPYYGDEEGLIKQNTSRNITIAGNILYNISSPSNKCWAITADWPGNNWRITGNVVMNSTNQLLSYWNIRDNGTSLIENNVLIGNGPSWANAEGEVYAQNLIYCNGSVSRSVNNLTLDKISQFSYSIDAADQSVRVSFTVSSAVADQSVSLVTTASLGTVNGRQILNTDGSAVTINKDWYQNCRPDGAAKIGPFQNLASGTNTFVLRPNTQFDYTKPCTGYDPQFTLVRVLPALSYVKPGATAQFTATALDQFGAVLANQPSAYTWTVTGGGTISPSGLFIAGSVDATFSVSASATLSGVTRNGSASVTVSSSPRVAAINAGGPSVGEFSADQLFTGGQTFSGNAAISMAGVANPGPAELYQTERYGNFSYTVSGLTAAQTYTVRLHFAEIYYSSIGARVFNVLVNGSAALSNFDIFATAGAKDKAAVRDYSATANASGQIVIGFVGVVDNAKVSGIELFERSATATHVKGILPNSLEIVGVNGHCLIVRGHGEGTMRIVNARGQVVLLEKLGRTTQRVHLASLVPGVYHATVQTAHTLESVTIVR